MVRKMTVLCAALGLTWGLMACGDSATDDRKAAGADEPVQFLFVQTADRVTFEGDRMTLHDVSPTTLFFSDRPETISGHGATREYVDAWGEGEDSFAASPPNATLCVLGEEEGDVQEVVVTLHSPVLEDGNLIYTVKVLEGDAPDSAKNCSLFVDANVRKLVPVSVDGRVIHYR